MVADKEKNSNLKSLVSGLVKEQVLKIVPVLKQSILKSLEKEIKYQISEAVNEKLMKVLLEGSGPRVGVQPVQSKKNSVSSLMTEEDDSQFQANRKQVQQKIRAQILSEGNPMLEAIYGDIGMESQSSGKLPPGVIPPMPQVTLEHGIVDSDDEGVNLDSFPEFRRR
jgi:hypothetical protein